MAVDEDLLLDGSQVLPDVDMEPARSSSMLVLLMSLWLISSVALAIFGTVAMCPNASV